MPDIDIFVFAFCFVAMEVKWCTIIRLAQKNNRFVWMGSNDLFLKKSGGNYILWCVTVLPIP
jgi:hypothetical protein